MEGVVDFILRDLLSSFGSIDICTTEFVRITSQLLPDKVFYKYAPELLNNSRTSSGTPVFVQLLGSDLTTMPENAHKADELGAFGIDLNFGCPAKRVNSHDGGASLLRDPSRVYDVVSSVRKVVSKDKPVTAKVRLGFDHKEQVVDIAQAAADGGASALIVHARTKMEGYRPPAHWHYIAQMREAINIPVVANGEIWKKAHYDDCVRISGCQHVMIGRGLVANPLLSLEIKNNLEGTRWRTVFPFVERFFAQTLEAYGEQYTVKRFKQLLRMMGQSFGEAGLLFHEIKTLKTTKEMRLVLGKFMDKPQRNDYLEPQLIVPKNF